MTMHAINWHTFFFLLFALISCVFAVAVVISGNIVRMAFYLVISLSAVAGLFFLAGADFVGAMQLMIYVGGTMVLLAFGVMLTASGPFVSMKIGRGQALLAAVAGGLLLALLIQAAFSIDDWTERRVAEEGAEAPHTAARLGLGLLGLRVDQPQLESQTEQGASGISGYLLPFEIVSVHLLVVLIGAAYLARAKKRSATPPAPDETETPEPDS
jgi:NADH:ubiquinone oxidoreductase subunit 6 (subunit J)